MEHEWLLNSIRRCGARGGTLRDIVAVGDLINHAVFTREELRTGLSALLKSGLPVSELLSLKSLS